MDEFLQDLFPDKGHLKTPENPRSPNDEAMEAVSALIESEKTVGTEQTTNASVVFQGNQGKASVDQIFPQSEMENENSVEAGSALLTNVGQDEVGTAVPISIFYSPILHDIWSYHRYIFLGTPLAALG